MPEYQGVWFDSVLDTLAMSAPAGLVFDYKLKFWKSTDIKWDDLPEKVEEQQVFYR